MFERLLAALIILALLVLVMFIALPYPTGSDRANAPVVDQPTTVEPAPPPSETARAKPPPAAGQDSVANNEAAPQPSEKPAAGAPGTAVPNPPGTNSAENASKAAPPAQAPTEKVGRQIGAGETLSKQKFVKTNQDQLPAGTEQPPKPVVALKSDRPEVEKLLPEKPVPEKPVPAKPKADKLKVNRPKTDTASRLPAQPPQHRAYIKDERHGQRDGIGNYIRRTDYGVPDWRRTHYHECADGQCDCSCDQPYWSRSGPPCWD